MKSIFESVVLDYEQKVFEIFKKEIDIRKKEAEEQGLNSLEKYMHIKKRIEELYGALEDLMESNCTSSALIEKISEYTSKEENDAIIEFQQKAEKLLESKSLMALQEEMKKIEKIMKKLDEVNSSYIYDDVTFEKTLSIK